MKLILGILSWIAGKLFAKPAGPPVADTENQQLGAAQVVAVSNAQAARTAGAVAQAEANAPNTAAGVVDAMQKGDF